METQLKETKACFGLMYHPDQPGHTEVLPYECLDCPLMQPCMNYIIATSLRQIVNRGVVTILSS